MNSQNHHPENHQNTEQKVVDIHAFRAAKYPNITNIHQAQGQLPPIGLEVSSWNSIVHAHMNSQSLHITPMGILHSASDHSSPLKNPSPSSEKALTFEEMLDLTQAEILSQQEPYRERIFETVRIARESSLSYAQDMQIAFEAREALQRIGFHGGNADISLDEQHNTHS